MSHQGPNEQEVTILPSEVLEGLMRKRAESWIAGATIWHFARVDKEVLPLLDRPALGCWFLLADATPPQLIALILSLHEDNWAVQADKTTGPAPDRLSPLEIQHRFEQLIAAIQQRSGQPLWTSDEDV